MIQRLKAIFYNMKANHITNKEYRKNPHNFVIVDRKKFYKIRQAYQNTLWLFGLNWHNHIDNECTLDFSCCKDKI